MKKIRFILSIIFNILILYLLTKNLSLNDHPIIVSLFILLFLTIFIFQGIEVFKKNN